MIEQYTCLKWALEGNKRIRNSLNERVQMTENEMKTLIEKTHQIYGGAVFHKIQYTMDFGELRIEYDFYLN